MPKANALFRLAFVLFASLLSISLLAAFRGDAPVASEGAPAYDRDGKMRFPEHYRDWVYLSTGFDMSYNPAMQMDHHMFDNVFVNPDSYHAFLANGTWPDKTVFVLETRGAQTKGSINQAGSFQSPEVMDVEVHVKDEARFPGKWAFFAFEDEKPATVIPAAASCYSCHAEHAAVDTTFVQFYPTLLPVAIRKETLSPAYRKEVANQDKK